MSQDVRIDKRIIKTKNSLKSALVELLKTQKIEEISIVELTNLAKVNRKTFYLHYNEVSSVFKEIENNTFEKAKHYVFNHELSSEEIEDFFYGLFKIFVEDEFVLPLLKETQYAKTFTIMIEKILMEYGNKQYEKLNNTNVSQVFQYTIAYHVFGSVRLFYTWLKNSQCLDIKSFSKFLATLIIKGSKGNFENLQ